MREEKKKRLGKYLIISQLSVYVFIILHSILWYVFNIHILTKLCPFVFAEQIGSLEFNFAILFWAAVLISTLFVGRSFCAWGCMFGAFQDFVGRLAKVLKIKPIKNKFGRWALRFIVFALLIYYVLFNQYYWPSLFWFIVMISIIGLVIWRFREKDASLKNLHTLPKYIYFSQFLGGIIATWISLNVFQKGFTFVFDKYDVFYDMPVGILPLLALFAAVVAFVVAFIEKRFFCKYLCPVGLLLRFMSAIPFAKRYKVRATSEKCIKCGKCNKECLMGITPMEEINEHGVVKDPNCINCLACVSVCPKNAIDFTNNFNKLNADTKVSINR